MGRPLTFRPNGQRQGYATVNPRTGAVNIYNPDSTRRGYGQVRGGQLQIFDAQSTRKANGQVQRPASPAAGTTRAPSK